MWVLPNGTLMVNICLNNGGAVSTIPSMYKVSAVARCLKLSSVAKAITLVLASEHYHRTGTAVDLHIKSLQILVVWSAAAKMMD